MSEENGLTKLMEIFPKGYLEYLALLNAAKESKETGELVYLEGIKLLTYIIAADKIELITNIPLAFDYTKHVVIYIKNDDSAKELLKKIDEARAVNEEVVFYGSGRVENMDELAFNAYDDWRFEVIFKSMPRSQKRIDDFNIDEYASLKRM
jgi:hypothetical protein